MQIQGSGRVKLTDGSVIRVHYDGKNGHPYSSIGRYLIEKGLLAADKVSMGALKQVAARPTPSAARRSCGRTRPTCSFASSRAPRPRARWAP